HRVPEAIAFDRCRWSTDIERALVEPEVVVALGATAARSQTGRPVTLAKVRGETLPLSDSSKLIVTIHPSYLLRLRDDESKEREYRGFRPAALRAAAQQGGL